MLCHHICFIYLTNFVGLLKVKTTSSVHYYNHLWSEHSAWYNDHVYMIKGGKREGKKGKREGERKKRKKGKEKGSREGARFWVSFNRLHCCPLPLPPILVCNFRALRLLQSFTVKLKLDESLSHLQNQFSLRVTVTDTNLLSYFGFWMPTYDIRIFRSWFSELSFLWSFLHLLSKLHFLSVN